MKDAVIAKLANQAADFYGEACKQCQYKDNLPKVCEGHLGSSRVVSVLERHREFGFWLVWRVFIV